MLLLQMLTIVLGLLIAGSRLVCLVSPTMSRRMMKGFLDRPLFVIILGLFAALYGASLFYAARRAVWGLEELSAAKGVWALIIGIVVCVAGFVILIKPGLFMGKLNVMIAKPDSTIRTVMGVGFVVGLAILALGVFGY